MPWFVKYGVYSLPGLAAVYVVATAACVCGQRGTRSCDHIRLLGDQYGGFLTLILYSLRAGVRSFHEGGVGKGGGLSSKKEQRNNWAPNFCLQKGTITHQKQNQMNSPKNKLIIPSCLKNHGTEMLLKVQTFPIQSKI